MGLRMINVTYVKLRERNFRGLFLSYDTSYRILLKKLPELIIYINIKLMSCFSILSLFFFLENYTLKLLFQIITSPICFFSLVNATVCHMLSMLHFPFCTRIVLTLSDVSREYTD